MSDILQETLGWNGSRFPARLLLTVVEQAETSPWRQKLLMLTLAQRANSGSRGAAQPFLSASPPTEVPGHFDPLLFSMINSNVSNTLKERLHLLPAFTVGTAITSASRDSKPPQFYFFFKFFDI